MSAPGAMRPRSSSLALPLGGLRRRPRSTEVGVRTSLFGVIEKRGDAADLRAGRRLLLPADRERVEHAAHLPAEPPDEREPGGGRPARPRRHHVQDQGRQQRLHRRERDVADRPEEGRRPDHRHVGPVGRRDQGAPRPAHLALGDPRRLQRDHERGVLPGHGQEPRSRTRPRTSSRRSWTPYGILVDMLQVQQHRFDVEYQAAINAQKQAEADVQTLVEQQKNMEVQKKSELEAKRSEWNQAARGRPGRGRPGAQRGRRLLPDEDQRGQGRRSRWPRPRPRACARRPRRWASWAATPT